MRRTQLYMDDDLWGTLRFLARQEGTSVSDLVRRAAREKYSAGVADRRQAMQAFAGIWKDRADLSDPEVYLRRLRKGSRLRRMR